MQRKSFTLKGKRYKLSPKIPAWEIERMVSRFSVMTPDEVISTSIRAAVGENPGWTPKLIQTAVRFALYCHHKNIALYQKVQRGNFI